MQVFLKLNFSTHFHSMLWPVWYYGWMRKPGSEFLFYWSLSSKIPEGNPPDRDLRSETDRSRTEVTFFLSGTFLKIVFWISDTTDFQTLRWKIKPIRLFNALCCPFLEFTSLAPLVAIFVILTYILLNWFQEKTSFYRWLNLKASPFCNVRLKPLFYNLILKFLLQTRPLQDGTMSEDADFLDQEWAGKRTSEDGNFSIFIRRPRTKTRTATRASLFKKMLYEAGLRRPRPRTSKRMTFLDVLVWKVLVLGRHSVFWRPSMKWKFQN